jgi:hypothetical protein
MHPAIVALSSSLVLLLGCSSATNSSSAGATPDATSGGCEMTWTGAASGSTACVAAILQLGSNPQALNISDDAVDKIFDFTLEMFKAKTYTLTDFDLPDAQFAVGTKSYNFVDAFGLQPLKGASASVSLTSVGDHPHGHAAFTLVQYDSSACATATDDATCGVGSGVIHVTITF